MNLQIKYLNIQPSENLDQYLKRRVDFAFSRFSNQILSIQIRLEDLNGPKGGYDQCCKVLIKLKTKVIIIESRETSLYTAIDQACDRSQRQVSRSLDRMRNRKLRFIPYNPLLATS